MFHPPGKIGASEVPALRARVLVPSLTISRVYPLAQVYLRSQVIPARAYCVSPEETAKTFVELKRASSAGVRIWVVDVL
jgi:hypothetical protein